MNIKELVHAKKLEQAYDYGRDGQPEKNIPCTCRQCRKQWHAGRQDGRTIELGQEPDEEKTLAWSR